MCISRTVVGTFCNMYIVLHSFFTLHLPNKFFYCQVHTKYSYRTYHSTRDRNVLQLQSSGWIRSRLARGSSTSWQSCCSALCSQSRTPSTWRPLKPFMLRYRTASSVNSMTINSTHCDPITETLSTAGAVQFTNVQNTKDYCLL